MAMRFKGVMNSKNPIIDGHFQAYMLENAR
jgi:hypothetical protein